MKKENAVEVTVISGLSGAGRSEAAKAFEDLGWFVIDNLPPQLIQKMISLALAPGTLIGRIALVIDARGGTFFEEADKALEDLGSQVGYRLVFLEASDAVLVRRFDATRRRHPLTTDEDVVEGLRRERELMGSFRDQADLIIDTSDLSSRDLRLRIGASFGEQGDSPEGLKTTVVSFGYKYGLPLDADLVLDVRFLPNPHWIDELRPYNGLEEPIRNFVMEQEATSAFLERLKDLLVVLLPGYMTEGRHYLTVAVGCTGGRHRSVVLAEEICGFIAEKGFSAKVIHRDVERSPLRA
ncbi:MAG TPA: RNase adapter RapZ [Actinomycetota bacterium]|nr:RNase adapter RapZ [Actinomycetota bacterium]